MSLLPIRFYDDPVLREKARPIETIEDRHHRLAADMAETMYNARGIGLAANQIGLLERIIVIDVEWARAEEDEMPEKKPLALINPEILEESVEDESMTEGCLSLPEIEGEVWRPYEVQVRYRTLEGKTVEEACEALRARCIQHEIDHLDGVLFIDRMGKIKRKLLNGSLKRLAAKSSGEAQAESSEG